MLDKLREITYRYRRVLIGISVATAALAGWAANEIDLLELLQRLAGLF